MDFGSYLDNIGRVRDALLTVDDNVGHFEAKEISDSYIVWSEDGEGNQGWGDEEKVIQIINGVVDLFTKSDLDEKVDKIQAALTNAKIAWKLADVNYEDDTKYIHYQWEWEVVL